MIPTRGKVFLNGQQFTTDPKIERNWLPRVTELKGIKGSNTVQDFDRHRKDMRLTLTSDGNFINAAFKLVIDTLLATRGAVYSYSDYTGLAGTVKIMNFTPKATFIRDGSRVLYEYVLELKVMTLTLFDGAAPIGS